MQFYKQHCYMFHVTHKVKQIKRLVTSSVKTSVRILVKLRICFLIADEPILAES